MVLQRIVYSDNPVPRIFRHLLFWTAYFLYRLIENLPLNGHYEDAREMRYVLMKSAVFLPVTVPVVYLSIYLILPRHLTRNRFSKAVRSCVLLFLAAFAMNYQIARFVVPRLDAVPQQLSPLAVFGMADVATWAVLGPFVFSAVALKVTKDHILRQRENQKLLELRLQRKFQLMRSRMQPAILLDALKDIHADIAGDYEKAPAMILHLSDLLRYVLYEAEGVRVDVAKEIKMMSDFVGLKKLSGQNKAIVDFAVSGDPSGHTIPPLLCLPLLDLVYRRSALSRADFHINIYWWLRGSTCSLSVTFTEEGDQPYLTESETSVLNTTRSALEMHFPGRHVFDYGKGDEQLEIFVEMENALPAYAIG